MFGISNVIHKTKEDTTALRHKKGSPWKNHYNSYNNWSKQIQFTQNTPIVNINDFS